MAFLPIALSLLVCLCLSVLPTAASHQCRLTRTGERSPEDPSIPSPSISSITNTSSTRTSTHPQPTGTPFVYGQGKIRGVNLCVVPRFPASPFVPDLPIPPLEVAGSC